jgi:hypothetical protein
LGAEIGCSLPLLFSTFDVSAGRKMIIELIFTTGKGALDLETLAVRAHIADGSAVARATHAETFLAWDGVDDLLLVTLAHNDALYKSCVRTWTRRKSFNMLTFEPTDSAGLEATATISSSVSDRMIGLDFCCCCCC